MLGYVDRDVFKIREEIPHYLTGDTTGKKYYLMFMRYPSKMICSSCATEYLKNKNSMESIIPYYLANEDSICSDCGKKISHIIKSVF